MLATYNRINLRSKNSKRGGGLKVEYNNKGIEKICTNAAVAEKKYGAEMAEKLQLRIDQIKAADSVEQMVQYRIGRCHPLQGNRKSQFAVDLVHPQRLIFKKIGNEVHVVNILEIVDYH